MKREAFLLPRGIYLDGNSLGPLTHAAQAAVERRLRQWQHGAVNAWEEWFALSERLSPALARLLGSHPDEIITTGTTTSNLHALLATFYRPSGERRNLLATSLDFPSDLYALRAWADREGGRLRLVPTRDGHTLHPDDLIASLTGDIALAWFPTVLYRSGQRLDVTGITREVRSRGILIGWDAAHSIGVMPHTLHDDGADFAVWCTYKYLNAGPGSPGGLFVHRRHAALRPGLPGWWGHEKESQFAMRSEFTPAPGAAGYQIGTPSILALAGLEGALAVFEEVDISEVRSRSLQLTEALIRLADEHLPELTLRTPRAPEARGGHVVFEFPAARHLSLGLRARGVTPDFRPPDLLRLTPAPLYNTEVELEEAVAIMRELLDSGDLEVLDEPLVT